jgi:multidrug efflux pump subunit AcrB
MNPIKKRPWLLIVAAFLVLIAGWAAFINLAVKNQPETVPLEAPATQ